MDSTTVIFFNGRYFPSRWFLVVLLAAGLSCTDEVPQSFSGVPLSEMDVQAEPWQTAEFPTTRTYLPIEYHVVARRDSSTEFSVLGLPLVSDDLYISEYRPSRVHRLNDKLQVEQSWGEGDGDGPGELQNPMDMVPLDDGRLLIADSRKRTIEVFEPDGTPLRSIDLQTQPMRMKRAGAWILLEVTDMNHRFWAYRVEDLLGHDDPEPAVRFGAIRPEQVPGVVMTTSGFLATNGRLFAFAQTFRPAFFVIDLEREEVATYPTVDAGNFDGAQTRTEGPVSRPPDQQYSGLSFAAGDTLYIQARSAMTDSTTVVDLYRLTDGNYLGSFSLPFRASYLSGDGRRLLTNSGGLRMALLERTR